MYIRARHFQQNTAIFASSLVDILDHLSPATTGIVMLMNNVHGVKWQHICHGDAKRAYNSLTTIISVIITAQSISYVTAYSENAFWKDKLIHAENNSPLVQFLQDQNEN